MMPLVLLLPRSTVSTGRPPSVSGRAAIRSAAAMEPERKLRSAHRIPPVVSHPSRRSMPGDTGSASTRTVGTISCSCRARATARVEVPAPPTAPVTAITEAAAAGEGESGAAVVARVASSLLDWAGRITASAAPMRTASVQSTGPGSGCNRNRCPRGWVPPAWVAVVASTRMAAALGACRTMSRGSLVSIISMPVAAAILIASGWSTGSVMLTRMVGVVVMLSVSPHRPRHACQRR